MRKVVEALDVALTRKLQAIDGGSRGRDLPKKAVMAHAAGRDPSPAVGWWGASTPGPPPRPPRAPPGPPPEASPGGED